MSNTLKLSTVQTQSSSSEELNNANLKIEELERQLAAQRAANVSMAIKVADARAHADTTLTNENNWLHKKIDEMQHQRQVEALEGLVGVDYVKEVTCKEIYQWTETSIPFTVEGTQLAKPVAEKKRYPIVAFDMGAKRNIFKKLSMAGFDVTVVPADTDAQTVRDMKPAGVFVSNGPGDPAAVTYAHNTLADLLPDFPVFGICMGHQIIAHAMGGTTKKLKFGHRGANQPVKNIENGYVAITSQNHGFAADDESLEACGAIVTEYNLNDQTVAGLRHKDWPVFSVQYHPEASPGPHDSDPLFDHFYELVDNNAAK